MERNGIPSLHTALPLQAWSGPEGSRKLRFPDFMTTAQDGGKVVSLMHRPPLPQEVHLELISVRGRVDPRAIVRPDGLSLKNSNDNIGNQNRDLPVCSVPSFLSMNIYTLALIDLMMVM